MDLPLGFCKTKYHVQDYVTQNNNSCNVHQKDTSVTAHQNSRLGILVQDNNNNFKSNFLDWLKSLLLSSQNLLAFYLTGKAQYCALCILQTCHRYWDFDRLGFCWKTSCHVWTNVRIKLMTIVSSLVILQKTMKLKCFRQETTFHKFPNWYYVESCTLNLLMVFDFIYSTTIPDCIHFKQTTCLTNNLRCTRGGCILFNSDMQGINSMQEVISIYFYSYKK